MRRKHTALFEDTSTHTHIHTHTHAVQQTLMLKHTVFWQTSPNMQRITDRADWLCTDLSLSHLHTHIHTHPLFLSISQSNHSLLQQNFGNLLLDAVAQYLNMWWKSCLAHIQPRCISTASASSEIWGASVGGAASALHGATAAIAADVLNA